MEGGMRQWWRIFRRGICRKKSSRRGMKMRRSRGITKGRRQGEKGSNWEEEGSIKTAARPASEKRSYCCCFWSGVERIWDSKCFGGVNGCAFLQFAQDTCWLSDYNAMLWRFCWTFLQEGNGPLRNHVEGEIADFEILLQLLGGSC